ncbi:KUP/HAK/KT family potassium transporter [Fodinicola feengrottensis]|uniref:KUP/HAK/KT family potassium transporter n=1 Tax=Fodinicola feengrottensis TaxID=435914 RepID=UPI002442E382|nr:hypothetical protein [Fodinicola feengrottensis]
MLHQHVVIVSVETENVPHVPADQRLRVDNLGYVDDGIVHLTARFGFQDDQDIPATLRSAKALSETQSELDIDPETASYFLSRITIELSHQPGMHSWRKRLFIGLANNAASPAIYFRLPHERTVVMGSHVDL